MRTFFWVPVFSIAVLAQSSPDFVKDVQPLLRSKCQSCHGAAQQMSGLRLDRKAAALAGGYSGVVIVPGKSADSALMARVTGAKGVASMPPGKPLAAAEIDVLRKWIDGGAKWPDDAAAVSTSAARTSNHWAFQAVQRPEVPARKSGWIRNAVDSFVLARLQQEKIAPAPEAPKAALLRRLSLDLTGLLPTQEELRDFLADNRPDAYNRQVDQLLESPHFGERWARPWLDRARYADSDGYEKDWARPYAWRYRQWVINALNRDMGFDQFTIQQLAGDMIPGASTDQLAATGFLRMTLTNREGGIDNKQFRFENTVDRVSTMGSAWLGLTVGCAQCHDHKFDPISQRDFYQLFAFFDHLDEVDIDAPMPGEIGPYLAKKDEYRAKREALLSEYKVAALQGKWETEMLRAQAHPGERTDWDLAWDCLLKLTENGDGEKVIHIPAEKRTQREQDILTDHFVRNYHFAVGNKVYGESKLKELDDKLRKLKDSYPQLTQAMAVVEGPVGASHLRVRGDYRSPGIEVEALGPQVLPAIRTNGKANRMDLAKWLVSADHPLTSRVTVNWVWQELFGRGLANSVEDFGVRGDRPSHPELLDYLASQFMDNGWSMKRLIRMIVTSATYRQSSAIRKELAERDPDNALLARQTRVRLPAELIRDAALEAGGLLSMDVGGPSVKPPQPDGVMELGYGNRWGNAWPVSEGKDRYRRGLYVHFQRSTPYPMLVNFDAPKANVAQCRRDRSNSPLQALNLLNDPVFQEAARGLAWMVTSGTTDWSARLDAAYERSLSRRPTDSEKQKFEQFFAKQKAQLAQEGIRDEAASWAALASVLMNLDEFITRE